MNCIFPVDTVSKFETDTVSAGMVVEQSRVKWGKKLLRREK